MGMSPDIMEKSRISLVIYLRATYEHRLMMGKTFKQWRYGRTGIANICCIGVQNEHPSIRTRLNFPSSTPQPCAPDARDSLTRETRSKRLPPPARPRSEEKRPQTPQDHLPSSPLHPLPLTYLTFPLPLLLSLPVQNGHQRRRLAETLGLAALLAVPAHRVSVDRGGAGTRGEGLRAEGEACLACGGGGLRVLDAG